jgi:chemotaxis protein MotB
MMPPDSNRRDRWLLPYADFVTLLFAVFVMMYAMEKSRHRQLSVSAPPPPAISAPQRPMAPALLDELQTNLIDERRAGFLTLAVELRGVVIALNDQTLFKPGEAQVRASAEISFDRIGRLLSRYPNHILLEGHTDSVPIHNKRFQSNWELSTARSMAVMQLLEQRSGLPGSRFSIGGSADNAPLSTDATEPGRARNRRVDIVVLGNSADLIERPVGSSDERNRREVVDGIEKTPAGDRRPEWRPDSTR